MSPFSGQREVRERGDEDYGPTVYKSSMYMNEDPEVSQESVFQLFPSPSKSEQNVPIEFYKTLDLRFRSVFIARQKLSTFLILKS